MVRASESDEPQNPHEETTGVSAVTRRNEISQIAFVRLTLIAAHRLAEQALSKPNRPRSMDAEVDAVCSAARNKHACLIFPSNEKETFRIIREKEQEAEEGIGIEGRRRLLLGAPQKCRLRDETIRRRHQWCSSRLRAPRLKLYSVQSDAAPTLAVNSPRRLPVLEFRFAESKRGMLFLPYDITSLLHIALCIEVGCTQKH